MGERSSRSLATLMFRPVLAALAALAVSLVAAQNAVSSTMPLFAWSGHSELASKPQSADAALASALSTGRTEMVMVYMLNEVSTQEMHNAKEAFTNLQDTLDRARSSTFTAVPVSKVDVASLLATAKVNGIVGHDVESSKLQGFLADHAALLSNGKPDVLIVRFPDDINSAGADAIIGSAEKAVSSATDGKYNSILSTLSSMEPDVAINLANKFFQSSDLRSNVHNLNANANTTTGADAYVKNEGLYTKSVVYGPSYYLTPTLLVAILVMIYMGVLLISAYCCLLSLQTPEKFEGDQEKDMARALNQDAK